MESRIKSAPVIMLAVGWLLVGSAAASAAARTPERETVAAGHAAGNPFEATGAPNLSGARQEQRVPEEPAGLLQPGRKVRVYSLFPRWREDTQLEGTFVDADEASLRIRIRRDDRVVTVPRNTIRRIEVARGKKSHWIAGALAGAGGGFALTALYCNDPPLGGKCDSADWAGTAAFFVGIGAPVGALIGAVIRTDRWTIVPPNTLALSMSPVHGRGVAFAMRLSF